MKGYLLFAFLLVCGTGFSQDKLSKEEQERREKNIEAGNPFARFGYKAKVATLSKGKYLEFHDLDSIVTIGSVRFNVYKSQIVGHIVQDTLNPDAQPIGDVTGRWMSPDPLSEEFPEWSPYTMVMDSPIRFNDPTGMAAEWTPDKNGNLIAEKGDNTKTLAKYLGTTTKNISNRFTLTSTGKSLSEDHEFTEGSKVVLNNTMSTDVKQFNDSGVVEGESCHNSIYPAIKGLEIGDDNNGHMVSGPLTDPPQLVGLTQKEFMSEFTQIEAPDEAVFGKTVAVFGGGAHSAVFYGQDQEGTRYYYSKNGQNGSPTISTESELQQQYGEGASIRYFNHTDK
ncbi:hypothetical protein NHF50_01035 [Flavobacterium sp. NRK F10]|uniref:hypothetical protein n=1 Tax=Flavobacterium sp. NRK F10 TaxID=2954931 RepID=UPI0020911FBC|nr:hypothetical protein [Flavobacterium sp. NRK F10]MCO6173620.1 hypothetical protein [Flavobacterium sp. NRK F10]